MNEFIKKLSFAFSEVGIVCPEEEAKRYKFRYKESVPVNTLVSNIVKEKVGKMYADFFTKKQRDVLKDKYQIVFSDADTFAACGILAD